MLPSRYRLKINEAKSHTWKDKKYIYTPLFKLVYRINQREQREPKIGFIVSGKMHSAVKRNRLRRLLSEAAGEKIDRFPKGTEAVFISRSRNNQESYEDVSHWIDKALSKVYIPAK